MPRSVITTTVAAPTSHVLLDLAIFKNDWAVTTTADDAFLTRAITRCSVFAETYCKRTFGVQTLQDSITLRRDKWPFILKERPDPLQLSAWPLVAIASVTEDGTVLTLGTDFAADMDAGQLYRLNEWGTEREWRGVSIVVVYQAGYVLPDDTNLYSPMPQPLPLDLQDAVSRMTYTRYAERQRDPLLKSEYVDGVGRAEYIVSSPDGNLSPDVEDILAKYRVPTVA
jgi:hypothetical protein